MLRSARAAWPVALRIRRLTFERYDSRRQDTNICANKKQANSQKSKCLETIKGYKAYLHQTSELPTDQKRRFDERLAKETELSAAWDERSRLLEDVSRGFAEAVKALCVSSDHGKMPLHPSIRSADANHWKRMALPSSPRRSKPMPLRGPSPWS